YRHGKPVRVRAAGIGPWTREFERHGDGGVNLHLRKLPQQRRRGDRVCGEVLGGRTSLTVRVRNTFSSPAAAAEPAALEVVNAAQPTVYRPRPASGSSRDHSSTLLTTPVRSASAVSSKFATAAGSRVVASTAVSAPSNTGSIAAAVK